MRVHLACQQMSNQQADILQYYLSNQKYVTAVKVYEMTADVSVEYVGSREQMCRVFREFQYETAQVPEIYLQNSSRELGAMYRDRLVSKVLLHFLNQFFLPSCVRVAVTIVRALPYLKKGASSLWHHKIEVDVLDAAAIGVSLIRQDMNTAGSTMFLLSIGETLEEWTRKRSVGNLARSMSLNVEKVWLRAEDGDVLVPETEVKVGDRVLVQMGNVIPFDGVISSGDAMVNQSSMTGEPLPIHKKKDGYVYAGTVVEEGELVLQVKTVGGASRFEKIVAMIEESEKMKSALENRAENLADKLVPYTLLGTGVTYALTRNTTKALSVLMVDFSCALKLAMPIAVLSAIQEASLHNITVKGGKYLEAIAHADTIVFDKTGTLTKAQPRVTEIFSFHGKSSDELLRIAACMEEHFPHSMAKAVVDAARARKLVHDETMHSKVEYIVAHGIVTMLGDKKAIIGSYHFVFEDEHCEIPEGMQEKFNQLPTQYSHLYLAIDQVLEAVICIEDPLREEAEAVVNTLRKSGLGKVVMMTGDSERTARAVATAVGVDEYYSEVLPEDKARYIEQEKLAGRTVIMVGDGINDSPALSAASVGIAINDGAQIAREIADVTIGADDLYEIILLKSISNALVSRIHHNYRKIVSINAGLILLGVSGAIAPTASAFFHNASTLLISMDSMKKLL